MGAIMGAVPAGIKGMRGKVAEDIAKKNTKQQVEDSFFDPEKASDFLRQLNQGRDKYNDEVFQGAREAIAEDSKKEAKKGEFDANAQYAVIIHDPDTAGKQETRASGTVLLDRVRKAVSQEYDPTSDTVDEKTKNNFRSLGFLEDEDAEMKETIKKAFDGDIE